MQPITDELIQDSESCFVSSDHPEKIIFFGSHTYGTPTKDSEFDLFTIMPTNEPLHRRAFPAKRILHEFQIQKAIIVSTIPQQKEKIPINGKQKVLPSKIKRKS